MAPAQTPGCWTSELGELQLLGVPELSEATENWGVAGLLGLGAQKSGVVESWAAGHRL